MIPLDPEAFKKNLGPGYKVGYFGSGFDLSDRFWYIINWVVSPPFRSENCVLKAETTNRIDTKWKRVQGFFKKTTDENRFGNALNKVYHAEGHLAIGEECKNEPDDFDNPMVFSEVSARDPIFYR